ncbi:MAG: Hpt domain-containing protein [Bacteroidia bacterium]|nr:Hpt domain-containing protein [Bacteroidia bacterium]NND26172.1 Hpt domain-containing protein [Flavobacteriaceae bacterium]MBT8278632.1 Hpt domain-containing protein [Bacteroidia bacterium]NNK60485.1 Hpt domain-containing protein [Flavobacteriaceae bacterium]NNL33058.1 Hpt domain-containing protein [Flavobacteriaceae bacterium]
MEQHYKLHKIRELSGNDTDFIEVLVSTFLEEVPEDARLLKIAVDSRDFLATYKTAHKMKPTVDLFELGVLNELIEVQDWGKHEQKDVNITPKLDMVLGAIARAATEIKEDFNL